MTAVAGGKRATRSTDRSRRQSAATLSITCFGCDRDEAALFRQLGPRYGITPTLTGRPLSELTVHLAVGSRTVSVDHRTMITDATLLALSRAGVRHLSSRSVGCNHLDVDYANRLGITVDTVGYSPDSVADYTIMLILMALRRAKATIRRTDARDYRLDPVRGRTLRDLTVGVVGTGRIGTAVIQRLKGFGCTVLAYDKRAKIVADYVPLDQLLQQSEVITLHTPLTAETHRLIDRQRIARMKRGAVVVNTGRGGLIETEALTRALQSGWLGGAALDVIEGEEGIFYSDCSDRPIAHPTLQRLQQLPEVIISPHTAYHTDRVLYELVEKTLVNCLTHQSGVL